MATEIDSLQIEINASATKANDAIDKLVKKLDLLSDSLGKINSSGLSGLASGVQSLGTAMQSLRNVRSNEFTRLANNIEKISKVDVSSLNNTATTISNLTNAFSGISAITVNSQQLGTLSTNLSTLARRIRSFENINSSNLSSIAATLTPLANGITALGNVNFNNRNLQNLINSLTRLSNANVSGLSSVNFSQLGNSISQLATSLQNAPNIHQSIISMTNAISNLSESGQNISIVSANLVSLGNSLRRFMSDMALAPSVSDNTISFSQAIATLANAGNRSGVTASNLSALGVGLRDLMTTLSTAPNVSRNVIDLTNALANLASQGSRVGSSSNSISRWLNRTSNSATRATRSFDGLASKIGKFYATFFLFIRGLKDIWKNIESTSDYIEAYNYFDVALGKIGSNWGHQYEEYGYDSAEEYAESFSDRLREKLNKMSGLTIEIDAEGNGLLSESGLKNLGLNIQEVTQYASQLASVTNSIGLSGETSLVAASTFTKLGADMSSLFNIDYSQVMNNLQSGLIGQSRALYKYGIDITNATLQTYAYELGLSKAVSEMTQAEKMQLRMLAILDQSKVAWGDLANTINSPSNMLRQFKNNLKEVGMVLGQLFIPLLQKVMPIINGVTIAIKRLLVSIAGFFGIKLNLSEYGQGFSEMEDDIGGVSDSLDSVASSAKKAKAGLRGFDELKVISMPDTSNGNGGIGSSYIDLTDEILKATEEYESAWQEAYNRMQSTADEFANKIEKIFEPVKKLFYDISIGDWFAVGQDVNTIVTGIQDFFKKAIDKVDWKKVGNDIGEFLKGLDWLEIIKKGFELKFEIWKAIADVWFGTFKAAPIETAILTALGLLKFTGLGKLLSNKLFGGLTGQIVGQVAGKSIGNSLFGGLTTAWTSLGGLGGILNTNLGKILASGTLAEIGLTIATGIIGGIAAGFAGFELGKFIGKLVTPDEFTDYYDNFHFFGDGGFFSEVSDDWGITLKAMETMATDFKNHPGIATLTNFLLPIPSSLAIAMQDTKDFIKESAVEVDLYGRKMEEVGLYMVQMGTIWQDTVLKTTKKTGKTLEKGIVGMNANAEKGLSKLGKSIKTKSDSISKSWEISMDFMSKTTEISVKGISDNINKLTSTVNKEMESSKNLVISGMSFINDEVSKNTINMVSDLSKNVSEMGSVISSQVGNIGKSINGISNGVGDSFINLTNGIYNGISMATKSLLSKTTDSMNGIIEAFEKMMNLVNSGTNTVISSINMSLGKYTTPVKQVNANISLGRITIPAYALGGFPEDGLFAANRSELVGQFSNGKTAVANNTQIIEGISKGVRDANAEQNRILMEQNTLLRAILEKETGISPDSIFKSVKQSASDYSKRTGRPAFQ